MQERTLAGRTPGATDPAGTGPGPRGHPSPCWRPVIPSRALGSPKPGQPPSRLPTACTIPWACRRSLGGSVPRRPAWGRGAARVPLPQGRPLQQPCGPAPPPPAPGGGPRWLLCQPLGILSVGAGAPPQDKHGCLVLARGTHPSWARPGSRARQLAREPSWTPSPPPPELLPAFRECSGQQHLPGVGASLWGPVGWGPEQVSLTLETGRLGQTQAQSLKPWRGGLTSHPLVCRMHPFNRSFQH